MIAQNLTKETSFRETLSPLEEHLSSIESLTCCPACYGKLAFEKDVSQFHCTNCNAAYPVVNGIIDFLPDYSGAIGRSQKAMENRFVSKIYEEIFRPLITSLGSDIRYQDEIEWLLKTQTEVPPKIILDLGCGSGKYARLLSKEYEPELTFCVDLSMTILSVAKEKAQTENLENIIFMRASADQLPIRSDMIDWVNCFGALHLFPDTIKALKEIGRISSTEAMLTCLTACYEDSGKLPLLSRLILTDSGFKFFKKEALFNLLQFEEYSLAGHETNKSVLLFRAVKN